MIGQISIKTETEILAGIEWVSLNPVEQTNKEFASYAADYIRYQLVKYPEFKTKFKAFYKFLYTPLFQAT